MRIRIMIAALAAALLLPAGPVAVAGEGGSFTDARPYLVALEKGVEITPIITAGDVVGGYQMSGIPDGMGWYQSGTGTIELFANHELDGRPAYARVSQFTL